MNEIRKSSEQIFFLSFFTNYQLKNMIMSIYTDIKLLERDIVILIKVNISTLSYFLIDNLQKKEKENFFTRFPYFIYLI